MHCRLGERYNTDVPQCPDLQPGGISGVPQVVILCPIKFVMNVSRMLEREC